jgi:carbonic anhydrase/acetyltransferase-like protein (isoleucine patch superfamily)
MPIYELDGVKPELPEADTFWIAPDAHVIGRVRLGQDWLSQVSGATAYCSSVTCSIHVTCVPSKASCIAM